MRRWASVLLTQRTSKHACVSTWLAFDFGDLTNTSEADAAAYSPLISSGQHPPVEHHAVSLRTGLTAAAALRRDD